MPYFIYHLYWNTSQKPFSIFRVDWTGPRELSKFHFAARNEMLYCLYVKAEVLAVIIVGLWEIRIVIWPLVAYIGPLESERYWLEFVLSCIFILYDVRNRMTQRWSIFVVPMSLAELTALEHQPHVVEVQEKLQFWRRHWPTRVCMGDHDHMTSAPWGYSL